RDGVATGPPLVVQPVAPADLADILAEIAVGPPRGRYVDVAGPRREDLVDMARRTLRARGHAVTVVPGWSGPLGTSMAGDVLLPGGGARITPTTFAGWRATQGTAGARRLFAARRRGPAHADALRGVAGHAGTRRSAPGPGARLNPITRLPAAPPAPGARPAARAHRRRVDDGQRPRLAAQRRSDAVH